MERLWIELFLLLRDERATVSRAFINATVLSIHHASSPAIVSQNSFQIQVFVVTLKYVYIHSHEESHVSLTMKMNPSHESNA
mmetsp:Transcript_8582/g.31746  ORF Transcript_8582/g.31746 Transcript_8582/m.31746 type:complete len:82 (+) Transcript_8582:1292-1537(+)